MFDQVLLQLLDDQDTETVPRRLELQHLHWEVGELEVVIHAFPLLLGGFPSVDET